jgi:hypothetical protein
MIHLKSFKFYDRLISYFLRRISKQSESLKNISPSMQQNIHDNETSYEEHMI